MKKFTKVFAVVVAIIAIAVGVLEAANWLHMVGVSSTDSGFSVTYKAYSSWGFIPLMRTVGEWIIFVLALIYMMFGWKKKSKKSNPPVAE